MAELGSELRALTKRLEEAQTLKELMAAYRDVVECKVAGWAGAEDLTGKIGASFSRWKWVSVRDYYGLDDDLPELPLDGTRVILPGELVEKMRVICDMFFLSLGPPSSGRELNRVLATFTLLAPLVALFEGSIKLSAEYPLQSGISQGRCEFVYHFLQDAIVQVVEAKKDNEEQGRAQLFLMLEATYLENRQRNIHMPRLYGAVTMGWLMQLYVFEPAAPRKERFKSIGNLVRFKYGIGLPTETKHARIQEFGSAFLGVLLKSWVDALHAMNVEQKLMFTRPTLSADSLTEDLPEGNIVDRAVLRAEALNQRLVELQVGPADDEEERTKLEARRTELFGRLNRLAQGFAKNQLENVEIDLE